ncbi:hypothetical protein [Streptomyces sp. AC602_WCS936]|uniref:hypothetical protein n=1 Tax=Streptomyces sp. AC602_WCS936 TaxID=2823685 RepID=UPI001C27FF82|nr:hypothetical protein [Streptomyces sp. AC602_WCS936]
MALVQAEELTRFHVTSGFARRADLLAAPRTAGMGQDDPDDDVFVSVHALRSLAASGPDLDWAVRFDDMVARAGVAGWTDRDRTQVRAHVVREASGP